MKTLHAKGIIIISTLMSFIPIPLLVYVWIGYYEGASSRDDFLLIIGMEIVIILYYGIAGWKVYMHNSIQYGEGKLVVRRYTKLAYNGTSVGRRARREDIIVLSELEQYGSSCELLGYKVESRNGGMDNYGIRKPMWTEIYFQLKDGRRIGGVEPFYYYPKEWKALCDYIYQETGIARARAGK